MSILSGMRLGAAFAVSMARLNIPALRSTSVSVHAMQAPLLCIPRVIRSIIPCEMEAR